MSLCLSVCHVIPPFPLGSDTLHAIQGLRVELIRRIGETLDRSLASLPGPIGVPDNRVAAARVQPRALRAVVGLVLTPGIIVEDEIALVGRGILVTEIAPAGKGLEGDGGRRGQ